MVGHIYPEREKTTQNGFGFTQNGPKSTQNGRKSTQNGKRSGIRQVFPSEQIPCIFISFFFKPAARQRAGGARPARILNPNRPGSPTLGIRFSHSG